MTNLFLVCKEVSFFIGLQKSLIFNFTEAFVMLAKAINFGKFREIIQSNVLICGTD